MKKETKYDIHLVIIAALKKELPLGWLKDRGIPVHPLAALKSGAFKNSGSLRQGMLVIITGSGLKASEEAACWIRDHIKPLFVLNIGTCGLIDKAFPLGEWIRPLTVVNEKGEEIALDRRLPISGPENLTEINSLLSVKNTVTDAIKGSLKHSQAVDMECFAQAKVFLNTHTTFHCLKFSTDYSDINLVPDFNKNLELFLQKSIELFSCIEDKYSITTVIPVHNRQETIRRAIDSVLSQSLMPDEIIVVDDGSFDSTKDILKEYGNSIKCIFLEKNHGPSKARNTGIENAQSEWVAFLDSDDCWEKDKLKNQIDYLRHYPFYQIMQSEEIWIRNNVRVNPCKHHNKPCGWIWEASLERCLVSPSGALIRRSLIEKYGMFNENLPACEDYDLWLKISRDNPVGLDPVPSVIKYGGHQDQLSRKLHAMDSFRVTSLRNLLEHEIDPYYRKKILDIISKKIRILINGYEKRGRTEEAAECREMLISLNEHNKSLSDVPFNSYL